MDIYVTIKKIHQDTVHPEVEHLIVLLQSTGSNDAKKYGPEVFEKMNSYHPKEPHWYLPLLGVDPLQHGKGLDSALMRSGLYRPLEVIEFFQSFSSSSSMTIHTPGLLSIT